MGKTVDAEKAEHADPHACIKNLTYDELATMSSRQWGLVFSIRSVDHSNTGTALKEAVDEMFPLAITI